MNEDDPDRRLEFCEFFIGMTNEVEHFADSILWSDEARFHISGHVNRHNCVYWLPRGSGPAIFEDNKVTEGINVWCGMCSETIIGPIFLEGTVRNDNYLAEVITPEVLPFMLQDDHRNMVFMQDGAPAHYSNNVRNILNVELEGRWIGRRGPVEWPARSPDLTPCDFFLWGYLKNKVYSEKNITSIEDLKVSIIRHVEEIRTDVELLRRVCRSVTMRVTECVSADGGHFEHKHN